MSRPTHGPRGGRRNKGGNAASVAATGVKLGAARGVRRLDVYDPRCEMVDQEAYLRGITVFPGGPAKGTPPAATYVHRVRSLTPAEVANAAAQHVGAPGPLLVDLGDVLDHCHAYGPVQQRVVHRDSLPRRGAAAPVVNGVPERADASRNSRPGGHGGWWVSSSAQGATPSWNRRYVNFCAHGDPNPRRTPCPSKSHVGRRTSRVPGHRRSGAPAQRADARCPGCTPRRNGRTQRKTARMSGVDVTANREVAPRRRRRFPTEDERIRAGGESPRVNASARWSSHSQETHDPLTPCTTALSVRGVTPG